MSSDSKRVEAFTIGPAGDVLRSLWQLDHARERVSRGMEAAFGVSARQRMMIRLIGKYPGVTASQLAGILHLDAGTVSTALTRLEQKDLLERRRGHRDGRRIVLGLTEAGRAVDQATRGTVEKAVEALLAETSSEDMTVTLRVLGEVARLLDEEATEGRRVPRTKGTR